MKNPYLYRVLFVCITISLLFTLSSIISTWSGHISMERYSYLDTSSNVWRSVETNNIYRETANVSEFIEYVSLFPILSLIKLSYTFAPSIYFPLIHTVGVAGSFIVFISWFIVFYLITYLYSKYIKKNYLKEPSKNTRFLVGCIISSVILSIINLLFNYLLS